MQNNWAVIHFNCNSCLLFYLCSAVMFVKPLMYLPTYVAEVELVGGEKKQQWFYFLHFCTFLMIKTVIDSPLSWLIQRFHFSRPESQYLILQHRVLPVSLGTETLRWMEERMRIWVLPFQVHGFTKGHHLIEVCEWPERAEKHIWKRIFKSVKDSCMWF